MNNTNKPDFRSRNELLVNALLSNRNPADDLSVIASKLYEVMTGKRLFCETDVSNGENYNYISGKQGTGCSFRLHPQVSHWFGWHTNAGHSTVDDDFMLIMRHDCKEELAEILRDRFEEFQKTTPCIEHILLDRRSILQGDDLFGMFMAISGESFGIGTGGYNKQEHREYHQWIELECQCPLTGELDFIDAKGTWVYSASVKSLFLGCDLGDRGETPYVAEIKVGHR